MRYQFQNEVAQLVASCRRSLRQSVASGCLFLAGCSSVWDSFLFDRCPSDTGCTQDLAALDTSDMPGDGAADLTSGPPTCNVNFTAPAPCGQPATLTWNCLNAKSCTRTCTGDVPKSGLVGCLNSEQIPISANNGERCTLSASNEAGAFTTPQVTASCIPPPQCSGSFGPRQTCGMNVDITWRCDGATSCTFSCLGTGPPASGSTLCSGTGPVQIVSPVASCTIYADGPGGQGNATATTSCL